MNADCIEWLNLLLEEENVYNRCKHNGKCDFLVSVLWVSRGVSQSLLLATSD